MAKSTRKGLFDDSPAARTDFLIDALGLTQSWLPEAAAEAVRGGAGFGSGGNPTPGNPIFGSGGNPDSDAGGNPLSNGGDGLPNAGGGSNGIGFGAGGNPDRGGNPGVGKGEGGGDGVPDKPDDAGNPGKGKGDGTGEGDGESDRPAPAPTPPDIPLLDPATVQYKAAYTFQVGDVTVGWDGTRLSERSESLDLTTERVLKDGTILNPIDSEFGFYVTDFVGARDKVFDGDFGEGWVGELADGGGIAVADARTDVFSAPARLGTWLEGIGGNTVKASTEHYSVMQAILSDQGYPGDETSYYNLDDNLWIVDYKVDPETGMPVDDLGNPSGTLVEDDFHHFHIRKLAEAMGTAEGQTEASAAEQWLDFNENGLVDDGEFFKAYMADRDFDGVTRNVAVLDFVNNAPDENGDTVDFQDGALNGFGLFGIQDFLVPNESSILEDIAVGDDYSVTVKDDGKLLFRWGNAVKRPNDIRIDTKIDLPDEWTTDDGSLAPLYRITAAELVVNHTVTNNPNDQIRPEDFENEAAIGILPEYVEVRDPFDPTNVLWVSDKSVYAGDGTFLPSYFADYDTGTVVADLAGNPIGYYNPGGTVLRDFSLIEKAEGSTLADIGALSEDLEEGFTDAYWTTMDREPFVADYTYDENGEPTGYVSGPRWRLQPDKYGQDLPSVVIPQDITDPPPIQNGEEKYEAGAETTTVLNLLDWDDTSPLALSAGWMTDAGEVSENGLNLTDQFDVAFYVKGDMKPVELYNAELRMEYEAVTINEAGADIVGTIFADTLVGRGSNTFDLSGTSFLGDDDKADLIVLGYGADATTLGFNAVFDFGVEEGDALGLIGFGLDVDNFSTKLMQEVDEATGDLDISFAGEEGPFATLYGVAETLEADSFYFA